MVPGSKASAPDLVQETAADLMQRASDLTPRAFRRFGFSEDLMESVATVVSPSGLQTVNRKRPSWSGDPSVSPRCGARTRGGKPCRAPAMWSTISQRYTRCRMHGGASTGPRTLEGREKCRQARWKHGRRSAQADAHRRAFRTELRMLQLELKQMTRAAKMLLKYRHERVSRPETLEQFFRRVLGFSIAGP